MLQPSIQRVGSDDIDAIMRAVSGDYQLVGALDALSPGLGQAAANLARTQRNVIGSSAEGRALNTHLPMINGAGVVAAAGSVALTATPLRNYKPNGLVIQCDGVAVTVDTITIANIPQLASNAGVVAADAFKRDAVIPYEINWDVIPMNQSLVATCTNRHAATATAIFGAVYGMYTLQ